MRFHISRTSGDTPPCEQADFDKDAQVWGIDVSSIFKLMELAKSNDSFNPGEIVLSYGSDLPGYVGNIEIYDDYRERG